MRKFENKHIRILAIPGNAQTVTDVMNAEGKDGWEAVCITHGHQHSRVIYFKREITS